MGLTLIATFNTKDEANHAVNALVEAGWERKAVSTTVRRELASQPGTGLSSSNEADAFKAIALVALIGAVIGGVIGLMLVHGTLGIEFEPFERNPIIGLLAGAICGLAVGTYSAAVASVRRTSDQHFHDLSPYLSAKERVMVSLTVPDERQEAVSRVLRSHGAFAVREWSLISNDASPRGLHV